jgi:outer membrane protein TolC
LILLPVLIILVVAFEISTINGIMKTTELMKENKETVMNFIKRPEIIFLLLTSVMLTTVVNCQTIVTNLPDSLIEQRLIALALKGPEFQRVTHENKANEYQLKSARNSWMNFLTVSANYNELTFSQSTLQQTYIYPKYLFGLNLPLGTLISSKQAKIAKERLEISTWTEEETRRKLKAEVLSKYKQYKAQSEIIKIETAYLNDLQVTLTQVDEKFKKNDPNITFENYNTALRNRNDQQAKLINLRLDQDLTRLQLEQIIGTSLETVLK